MSKPTAFPRRQLLGAAFALAGLSLTRHAAGLAPTSAKPRPIEIGILPYLPTATLMTGHQALRHHFEETFRRPVILSTAPDFHIFQQRVARGEFDFLIIGPGPGWQAHLDHGWQAVAISQRKVVIFIVVLKDGPITRLADLRGQTLATIDPMTVTAQTTRMLLREHKLNPDVDVRIRNEKTPYNAARTLLLGDAAAIGVPNVIYPTLPPDMTSRLRILLESPGMPGVLFMARPAPDMPSADDFQDALFRFAASVAGKQYLKDFNHGALLKPDLKALQELDRFVPEIRHLLGKSP